MADPERKGEDQQASGNAGAPKHSAPYPRNSLKEAEEFARHILDEGAHYVSQENAARAAGFSGSNNGSFKRLRAAARYFGLVEYNDNEHISVAQPWIDAFVAGDSAALGKMRQIAVLQPELYQQLAEQYGGKQLPNPEKLARVLFTTRAFGIRKDAAQKAAEVFLESVGYAGLLDGTGHLRLPGTDRAFQAPKAHAAGESKENKASEIDTEQHGQLRIGENVPEGEEAVAWGQAYHSSPAERHETSSDSRDRGMFQRYLHDWRSMTADLEKKSWPV
jgi:hypothetical protein